MFERTKCQSSLVGGCNPGPASNKSQHVLFFGSNYHVLLVFLVSVRCPCSPYAQIVRRTTDPTAQNFHPVSSAFKPNELFGALEQKDTEWLCAGGFVTETQIWYTILEDGTSLMCQIIHSSVGVWYPQIQFTFKLTNPQKKETTWRSVNVSNFVTPPPGLDRRSSKADQFAVTHKTTPGGGEFPESYALSVNLGDDLKVILDVRRPAGAPGFKAGQGAKGGYSYFGADAAAAEGYVVHRFWPHTQASGTIVLKGRARAVAGPGMFVHAIQGMRPNLVAARWNFVHFQSAALGGTSAIQMEFTTTDAHGRTGADSGRGVANVGGLVVGGKLVAVTAETAWGGVPEAAEGAVVSRAEHVKPVRDPETSYEQPTALRFAWRAPTVLAGAAGDVSASLLVDVGEPGAPKGLIEKVDVLAEIPGAVKAVVSYVAGVKPYIYQWINPAKLALKGPEEVAEGASNGIEVEGYAYIESTFISA